MLRRPLPPSRGTAAPPRVAARAGAVRTAKGGLNERAKAARPRTAASTTADADRGDDDGRLAPVDVTIGGCGLSFFRVVVGDDWNLRTRSGERNAEFIGVTFSSFRYNLDDFVPNLSHPK